MLKEIEKSVRDLEERMAQAVELLKSVPTDSLAVQEAIEVLDNHKASQEISFNLLLMKSEVKGARMHNAQLKTIMDTKSKNDFSARMVELSRPNS